MRVSKLKATNVHGYLPMDVSFFPDLTFLIGLNGSGKTTALRLLMGLLTPAIDELARIEFSNAEVVIDLGPETVTIRASRDGGSLTLSVSDIEDRLTIEPATIELLLEPSRREESRSTPVLQTLQQSPVYARVRSISTPMFLGLERRMFQEDRLDDPGSDAMRRRHLFMRRRALEEVDVSTGFIGAGLAEVLVLVRDTMSEIRAKQEKLDRDLRERLLLSAVRFTPSEFDTYQPPSMQAISKYRERQAELRRAATLLRLPIEEVQASLEEFFKKMSDLAGELTPGKKKGSPRKKDDAAARREANALMTWLVNKSQVDRILENLGQFESYARERQALHGPVDRLIALLNKFLVQSKKQVEITDADRLVVRLPDGRVRSTAALSSGERQLCVMLGQLSLNPQLSGSGVFIVDEPEVSLHLSWQEMFVDSVRAANAEVQLIFATHSPAIVMNKDDRCRSLSPDANANA